MTSKRLFPHCCAGMCSRALAPHPCLPQGHLVENTQTHVVNGELIKSYCSSRFTQYESVRRLTIRLFMVQTWWHVYVGILLIKGFWPSTVPYWPSAGEQDRVLSYFTKCKRRRAKVPEWSAAFCWAWGFACRADAQNVGLSCIPPVAFIKPWVWQFRASQVGNCTLQAAAGCCCSCAQDSPANSSSRKSATRAVITAFEVERHSPINSGESTVTRLAHVRTQMSSSLFSGFSEYLSWKTDVISVYRGPDWFGGCRPYVYPVHYTLDKFKKSMSRLDIVLLTWQHSSGGKPLRSLPGRPP